MNEDIILNSKLFLILIILVIATHTVFVLKMNDNNTKIKSYINKIDSLNTIVDSLMKITDEQVEIQRKIDYLTNYSIESYEIAKAIHFYSNKYGLDHNLLIGIAYIESNFYQYAINPNSKCKGIWQINDKVHEVDKKQIFNINYNAKWGSLIFVDKLRQYKGNVVLALNSYNGWASYKNPYSKKVLKVVNKIVKI